MTAGARSAAPRRIVSSANPLVKELRAIARDAGRLRKTGQIWIEGEHLCSAAAARGLRPERALFSESLIAAAQPEWAFSAVDNVVFPDRLFASLSTLESPAGMAWVLPLPAVPLLAPGAPTVLLDRLQDPGNVGSILRSAAAFGFAQVLALQGTVALWAPKVLRAGMGAHFGLQLIEDVAPADIDSLALPVLQTSSHQGELLHRAALPRPCAWVFGHEGQGIAEALATRLAARSGHVRSRTIRIVQPGGEESLNVAAAAAICLHASAAGA